MEGDGAGWVRCALGHTHWGRYGAAGLLVAHRDRDDLHLLLQHRAGWSHHGGTWGVPGGARFSTETAEQAARRETLEEMHIDLDAVAVVGRHTDAHGGWTYDTIVASASVRLPAAPRGAESFAVRWVPLSEVPDLPLHPGFAATLADTVAVAVAAVDG